MFDSYVYVSAMKLQYQHMMIHVFSIFLNDDIFVYLPPYAQGQDSRFE